MDEIADGRADEITDEITRDRSPVWAGPDWATAERLTSMLLAADPAARATITVGEVAGFAAGVARSLGIVQVTDDLWPMPSKLRRPMANAEQTPDGRRHRARPAGGARDRGDRP